MRAKVRAGFWLLLCCWQFGALSAQSYVGVSDTLVVKDSVSAAACCLQQQELPFWFSARGSVDWQPEGEEAVRFTMFYAVAKDSLLYVHLSKFGIELARALFRPDSVFLLLSATGNYWTGTYAVLGRKVGYPVDFSLLQGLLTAMPDAPYVQTDSNGLLRTAQWGAS
ncbi:MAG: DUF4292 domain-containing protein, partial [Bacteroidales bacterium]|nr:DUF4292 domain-containing protein [Bacteroidales bacterium]